MENQLTKRELGDQFFIERLIANADSLEAIKKIGMVIIESGFCPQHFKESKDAVGVIMCIEAGRTLGLSWMQSLSDIYPVKGRIGIMGTAAKAVIFASGVLEDWKEYIEGEYPQKTYKHVIVSKRKNMPSEFKTEFSIFDAETAGLMTRENYKKYGKRMVYWRAVGFHAADYYPDILKGMKTVEELQDFDPALIANEGDMHIITKSGKTLKIQGQDRSNEVAEKISDEMITKIDSRNGGAKKEEEEAQYISTPETVVEDGDKVIYNEEYLTSLKTDIYELTRKVLPAAKFKILESLPGRKSQKRFVNAILAFQDGTIDNYLTDQMTESGTVDEVIESQSEMPNPPLPKNPTLDFEQQKAPDRKLIPIKEQDIVIPDLDDSGRRGNSERYQLYKILINNKISSDNFYGKTEGTELSGKYGSLQEFIDVAPESDVKYLLSL